MRAEVTDPQRRRARPRMGGPHHWPVTLHTGPVGLTPIRPRDRVDWERVRRQNRDWLRPWEATLPPGSAAGPGSFSGLARELNRQAREGRVLPWIVRFEPGGARAPDTHSTLVGQLTVSSITGGSASLASIGYWVDQRWAGHGIIPAAVALASDYCFEVMRLHRIEIAIRPENEKSLRVVDKLGFRPEGLRQRFLHIDGGWRDHLVFALTAEEVPEGLLHRWRQHRAP